MLARVLAFVFVAAVLGAPLAGLVSFTSKTRLSSALDPQKSMCMTQGLACGPGHVLIPAVGRM